MTEWSLGSPTWIVFVLLLSLGFNVLGVLMLLMPHDVRSLIVREEAVVLRGESPLNKTL